jgi:hypothetical protein
MCRSGNNNSWVQIPIISVLKVVVKVANDRGNQTFSIGVGFRFIFDTCKLLYSVFYYGNFFWFRTLSFHSFIVVSLTFFFKSLMQPLLVMYNID